MRPIILSLHLVLPIEQTASLAHHCCSFYCSGAPRTIEVVQISCPNLLTGFSVKVGKVASDAPLAHSYGGK